MASAVCTESQTHPDRRPLSLCLDVPPSSSPFPSPSSSFLPPPMPGAHEFAVKPPPSGRNSRKPSLINDSETTSHVQPSLNSPKSPTRPYTNGNGQSSRDSSLLPLMSPSREQTISSPLPSSQATTPTPATITLLPSTFTSTSTLTPTPTSDTFDRPKTPSSPQPPLTSLETSTSAPTPNRPAPPSPDISRRISSISTASARSRSSRSSRPPSAPISRNNSTRKAAARLSQQHISPLTPTKAPSASTIYPSPLPSPHTFTFTTTHANLVSSTPRTLMHVRDFAFPNTDERFKGLGPDVPRENKIARLNRRLKGTSTGSYESSEDENENEGEDDEDGDAVVDAAWDKLRHGGWGGAVGISISENGPSQNEIDWNFGEGTGGEGYEDQYGEEDEEDEEEEPLYPGLYKALYTFQPEGTAEMALAEDQIVRVVGRGGGVGWAVVLDESAGVPDKHALVPESYLEPFKLDWEEAEDNA